MKLIKRMMGNQKGFSLTEVVIAMAVFGVIGVSIMLALNASSETIVSAHEMTIAESLTRSVIEYVKRSDYDSVNFPTAYYDSDAFADGVPNAVDYGTLLVLDADPYYGDYDVVVDIDRLNPESDSEDDDDGLQAITVEISYHNRSVLTTKAYKVNR
jgi:prepilin-type N-terminal cleavage/methylation domain-containing protein